MDRTGVRGTSIEVATGVVDVVVMTTPSIGELMPLRPGCAAEFDVRGV